MVTGHYQYYGVPLNLPALRAFREQVIDHWRRAMSRRSQKARVTVARMDRLARCWLPRARVHHPYPSERLRAARRRA